MTTESPSYSTIEQAFSLGNGQDSALNWLRKNRSQVAIFLVSGIKLEGTISGFDQYSVLLTDAHGNQQLVYKAKISTIAMHSGRPAVSIQRPQATGLHGAAPPWHPAVMTTTRVVAASSKSRPRPS
jgi:host factor-I protein